MGPILKFGGPLLKFVLQYILAALLVQPFCTVVHVSQGKIHLAKMHRYTNAFRWEKNNFLQKAIPKGTLLAIAVTTVIYLLVVLATGSTCVRYADGFQQPYLINGSYFIPDCAHNNTCPYGLMNYFQVNKLKHSLQWYLKQADSNTHFLELFVFFSLLLFGFWVQKLL